LLLSISRCVVVTSEHVDQKELVGHGRADHHGG
jgi:hypothetical protein